MRCLYCNHSDLKVTDKRESGEEIRRRRECLKCGKRFTTYERIELGELFVLKKDGRREAFSREKIKAGIIRACEKRDISLEEIDKIVDDVEDRCRKKGKEIKSHDIGEQVINKLKKLNQVAYIRFASVYRDFKDLSDFKKEMKNIQDAN